MKSKYIAYILVIVILASALAIFAGNAQKPDLKSKCCAECIEGFQQEWTASPYCIDKSKMSAECINYLGISNLDGISTAEAYSTRCG
jgi:hypothetical protein